MVYYMGEGSTNIFIPKIGDTTITNGRPIYLKNASFNVIEALRTFRSMQIDLKINAKQDGAFRIIDFTEVNDSLKQIAKQNTVAKEQVSQEEIDSILKSGSTGPIVLESSKSDSSLGDYKLPSGQYEGKTLSEMDKAGKLKAIYSGFKSRNPEVKEAIEKYYNSVIK
jgi:hypothetical protein